MKPEHIAEAVSIAVTEVYGDRSPDIQAGIRAALLSHAGITAPLLEHTTRVVPGGIDWAALTPEELTGRITRT